VRILYHHRVASRDGQYVHIEEIIGALRHLGHEVIVVSPGAGKAQSFGSDGGVIAGLKRRVPKATYELLEFGYTFVMAARLWWIVRRRRPDIVYERFNLFHPAGLWVKQVTGLPLILEVNAPLYEERVAHGGIALKGLARWSQSYTWRRADAVLPVTQVLADHVVSYGAQPERITVLHNGINAGTFMAAQAPPTPLEPSTRTVLVRVLHPLFVHLHIAFLLMAFFAMYTWLIRGLTSSVFEDRIYRFARTNTWLGVVTVALSMIVGVGDGLQGTLVRFDGRYGGWLLVKVVLGVLMLGVYGLFLW